MTIWNALSAGAALWCAGLAIYNVMRDPPPTLVDALVFHAGYVLICLAFGLFLWGAIP